MLHWLVGHQSSPNFVQLSISLWSMLMVCIRLTHHPATKGQWLPSLEICSFTIFHTAAVAVIRTCDSSSEGFVLSHHWPSQELWICDCGNSMELHGTPRCPTFLGSIGSDGKLSTSRSHGTLPMFITSSSSLPIVTPLGFPKMCQEKSWNNRITIG